MSKRKAKLLGHEKELLSLGELVDVTHKGSSPAWLQAPSKLLSDEERVLCYRHMGDTEYAYLHENNQLPSTQPYQTITRDQEGRQYCESYLRLHNKYVDTNPSTVVEFDCSKKLINDFFQKQFKIEDGTISHGLGDKAGKTLARFNEALAQGFTRRWRIVLVKRRIR